MSVIHNPLQPQPSPNLAPLWEDDGPDPADLAPTNSWFFFQQSRLNSKGPKLEHTDFWVIREHNTSARLFTRFMQHLVPPSVPAESKSASQGNLYSNQSLAASASDVEAKVSSPFDESMPSLNWALWRTFWPEILFLLFLQFLSDVKPYVLAVFSFGIPVFVPFLVEFVENPEVEHWYGYIWAGSVLLSTLLSSLFYYKSQWLAAMLGLRLRAVLMAAVYEKVLTSPSTIKAIQGKIANLFANDSAYIFNGTVFLAPGLIAPLQFIAVTVLLYFQVQWLCFINLGVMFLLVLPISIGLAKYIGGIRVKMQEAGDRRLKLSQELMRGIKIVKYYAWEEPLMEQVDEARRYELQFVRTASWSRVWVLFITTISGPIIIAVTLVLLGQMGGSLNTSLAFAVMSLINILRAPAGLMAGMFPVLFNVTASLNRFYTFLRSPNRQDYVNKFRDKVFIEIRNGDFSWDGSTKTLSGINLKVKEGDKMMVVGGVAAGKSSLALTILGEIPKIAGSVAVGGSVAYVPQQAWTFSGTLRDNILFGMPYDKKKLEKVLRAASLDVDIQQLPDGDMTVIGERGVTLSGGQRQRISIARGLYQDADIYVLDDPFSALDTAVTKRVFRKAVRAYLKDKTVLLTTNNLHIVRQATEILYLFNGSITGRGTFDYLYDNHVPFKTLCKTYGADKKTKYNEHKVIHLLKSINTSPSLPYVHTFMLLFTVDSDANGASSAPQQVASPRSGGAAQGNEDHDEESGLTSSGEVRERNFDVTTKYVKGKAMGLTALLDEDFSMSESSEEGPSAPVINVAQEQRSHGVIPWKIIHHYIYNGGYGWFIFANILFLIMAGARFGSSWWLAEWSKDAELNDTLRQ